MNIITERYNHYIILSEQVRFLLSDQLTNHRRGRDITPDAPAAHWTICSETTREQPIGSVGRSDDARGQELSCLSLRRPPLASRRRIVGWGSICPRPRLSKQRQDA